MRQLVSTSIGLGPTICATATSHLFLILQRENFYHQKKFNTFWISVVFLGSP